MATGLGSIWAASSPDAGFAAAGRQKGSFLATLSPPHHQHHPVHDPRQQVSRHPADPFGQQASVDRGDEAHVGDRIAKQPRSSGVDLHVARRSGAVQVGCERHDDDRADAAAVEGVALDDDDGSAAAGA